MNKEPHPFPGPVHQYLTDPHLNNSYLTFDGFYIETIKDIHGLHHHPKNECVILNYTHAELPQTNSFETVRANLCDCIPHNHEISSATRKRTIHELAKIHFLVNQLGATLQNLNEENFITLLELYAQTRTHSSDYSNTAWQPIIKELQVKTEITLTNHPYQKQALEFYARKLHPLPEAITTLSEQLQQKHHQLHQETLTEAIKDPQLWLAPVKRINNTPLDYISYALFKIQNTEILLLPNVAKLCQQQQHKEEHQRQESWARRSNNYQQIPEEHPWVETPTLTPELLKALDGLYGFNKPYEKDLKAALAAALKHTNPF